jgi:hypothetical protein
LATHDARRLLFFAACRMARCVKWHDDDFHDGLTAYEADGLGAGVTGREANAHE